jgi:hypothetical protein
MTYGVGRADRELAPPPCSISVLPQKKSAAAELEVILMSAVHPEADEIDCW